MWRKIEKKDNCFSASDYQDSDARHLIRLPPIELFHTSEKTFDCDLNHRIKHVF